MQYIDEKFKEAKPEDTVAKINEILNNLGIEVFENWNESGVENCFSLSVSAKGGFPSSNGKGITKEFARASAYAEFIERLQGGLHLYKLQSIGRINEIKLQNYAPDAKYMTVEELENNGDWMDLIVEEYNNPNISRKSIAEYCKIFACADDNKILTVPFYSLFEKKYVYLPIDFVDQIYASNGCCAGNTRDEAWVHALSEILERNANLKIFTSGKAAPKFSEDVIEKFPVVSNIIKKIRESGDYDIDIFDYSLGSGFPIVSTRIINKKTHSYKINVAADPIFQIALQRTLTELFQGRNLENFASTHSGTILNKFSDFPYVSNVVNQLETGSGLYTADYFANEITCNESANSFEDNTNKNNTQLLEYILNIFKKQNKQIYVRNFSYLGFPSYRFVVPGFSETFICKLYEPLPEYSIGDKVCKTLRNPINATADELNWLLVYSNMIKSTFGRYNVFSRISGVPISWQLNGFLSNITRAYASYQLKSYDNAVRFLSNAIGSAKDFETSEYLTCLIKYIELQKQGIKEEKIKNIIYKFFRKIIADKLYYNLETSKSPFVEYLLECDFENCENCKYNTYCSYENVKYIIKTVGDKYSAFTQGQNETEFAI